MSSPISWPSRKRPAARSAAGRANPSGQVVVTYRAQEKGGDLVAVEFVPASFVLDEKGAPE